MSIDFEFPPYIVTGQECIDKVTDPECLAVSTKDHPPRTRKCKQVRMKNLFVGQKWLELVESTFAITTSNQLSFDSSANIQVSYLMQ